MPEYYNEKIQAYWLPSKKLWTLRYLTSGKVYDTVSEVVLTDCTFFNHKKVDSSYPSELISGIIDTENPPIHLDARDVHIFPGELGFYGKFVFDDITLTKHHKLNRIWLRPDHTIVGMGLSQIEYSKTPKYVYKKPAVPWICEHYYKDKLINTQRIMTITQWNAVRYLLKIRKANRAHGVTEGLILRYNDQRGNLIIVRPAEKSSTDL